MSGVSTQDCPYCKTKSVAFTARYEWRINANAKRALFVCGSCNEGIIRVWQGSLAPTEVAGALSIFSIVLGEQWPKAAELSAPLDTPPGVARFFEQGTSSLESGNFDAAAVMFRKALESSTKVLLPDSEKKPLIKRIDRLAEEHKVTPDMAAWAHEIRLGGNDAAHEDEPFTLEQAQDLRNFTENFFRYAFTLPSSVRRRAGRGDQKSEKE